MPRSETLFRRRGVDLPAREDRDVAGKVGETWDAFVSSFEIPSCYGAETDAGTERIDVVPDGG